LHYIISIDPSLTSTAVVVRHPKSITYFSFFKDFVATNKWCADLAPFVDIEKVYHPSTDSFSENENMKYFNYKRIVNQIIKKLEPYLDKNPEIRIESYSQQSKNGRFQDLITYGTLLRDQLYKYVENIYFVAPKELKRKTARHIYDPDTKGVHRNTEGTAGGSFSKWDMFNALLDTKDNSLLIEYCRKNKSLITTNKNLPKPLEDLIDAELLSWINIH
jgi:hypothetical protein